MDEVMDETERYRKHEVGVFQKANEYFKALYRSTFSKKIEMRGRGDLDEFVKNLYSVFDANSHLQKYSKRALEFLASNDFIILRDVLDGKAQAVITKFKEISQNPLSDTLIINKEDIGTTKHILEAYEQILPYELQIMDYNRLEAVKRALKMSNKRYKI